MVYILFFALIASINYIIGKKNVLYPAFIYSFLWTVIFSAYIFSPIEVDPIRHKTAMLLLFGVVAFSAGCYLSRLIRLKNKLRIINTPYQDYGKYFLFIYCLAVFPWFYRDIAAISGGGLSSLVDLRLAMINTTLEGQKSYSSVITGSIVMISISTTFILFIEKNRFKRLFYLSFLISIVYCILNTSRVSLLILASGLVAIYLIKSKSSIKFQIALTSLGVPVLIFISAMMAYMFATHLTVDGGALNLANNYFFIYLIGGIPALDTILKSNTSMVPHHTFQIFFQLSNSIFGTHFSLPPPLDAFVQVPFPTNVYTIYKFYFQDFGFVGTLCALIIIGFIHGAIFRIAKLGNRYGIYFYAIFMYPLLMSFFDDGYSDFRGLIRNSMVVFICYFIIPKMVKLVSISKNNYIKI